MNRPSERSGQAPDSYTPDAVQAWLGAGDHTQVRRMDAFRNPAGRLENLEIHLEVDSKATRVRPSQRFLDDLTRLAGVARFEPHNELAAVAELVVQALAKGRFHGFLRVVTDGEALYEHSDKTKQGREVLQLLAEASNRSTRCDAVTLTAVDDEFGDTRGVAELRKIPKRGEHTIQLRFEGEVPEGDFHAMLAHLREHMDRTYEATAPA